MLNHLRPAIVMIVLLSALTGLAYPLAVTGVAQALLKGPADGSLALRDGKVVGSALIGQSFVSDGYFHGRPSATSAADPNDASTCNGQVLHSPARSSLLTSNSPRAIPIGHSQSSGHEGSQTPANRCNSKFQTQDTRWRRRLAL